PIPPTRTLPDQVSAVITETTAYGPFLPELPVDLRGTAGRRRRSDGRATGAPAAHAPRRIRVIWIRARSISRSGARSPGGRRAGAVPRKLGRRARTADRSPRPASMRRGRTAGPSQSRAPSPAATEVAPHPRSRGRGRLPRTGGTSASPLPCPALGRSPHRGVPVPPPPRGLRPCRRRGRGRCRPSEPGRDSRVHARTSDGAKSEGRTVGSRPWWLPAATDPRDAAPGRGRTLRRGGRG